ncbi:hypothetical protein [Salidesulfovibrio brasiliensis]|uniref:hypothetical protein n=1 Tax=Salidesulfovibrio brasiliensis TaxID=221711 RepID=UPI0006D2C967|nr:hypothetical protein [Salidesulfovibrio brasiliensis]
MAEKETVASVNVKLDALLDVLIEDGERRKGEGKAVPELDGLYEVAGKTPPEPATKEPETAQGE